MTSFLPASPPPTILAQPRAAIKLAQPGSQHTPLPLPGPSWSLIRGHVHSAPPSPQQRHAAPVALLGPLSAALTDWPPGRP